MHVNEACAQANNDDLYGPLSSYIKNRLFVAQNMFDSDQLYGHLGCPCEVRV